jgi:multidrug resistance efflux pump
VKKGQTLFTIGRPDLLQAESTLIAAAGVLQLATRNLARLRELYKNLAISQRELDQAASDQQTAKAICGRRCQQEAPNRSPFVGATRQPPVSALEMSFALAAASCYRP